MLQNIPAKQLHKIRTEEGESGLKHEGTYLKLPSLSWNHHASAATVTRSCSCEWAQCEKKKLRHAKTWEAESGQNV